MQHLLIWQLDCLNCTYMHLCLLLVCSTNRHDKWWLIIGRVHYCCTCLHAIQTAFHLFHSVTRRIKRKSFRNPSRFPPVWDCFRTFIGVGNTCDDNAKAVMIDGACETLWKLRHRIWQRFLWNVFPFYCAEPISMSHFFSLYLCLCLTFGKTKGV